MPTSVSSGKLTHRYFTADSVWTCPAGVTQILVIACGGGGGGGGAQNGFVAPSSTGHAGGGGGAGAIQKTGYLNVTPGTQYNIYIGLGGAGGTAGTGGSSLATIGNPGSASQIQAVGAPHPIWQADGGSGGSQGTGQYYAPGGTTIRPFNLPANDPSQSTVNQLAAWGGQGAWQGTVVPARPAAQAQPGIKNLMSQGGNYSPGSAGTPPLSGFGTAGGGGQGPQGNGGNGGSDTSGGNGQSAAANSGAGGGGGCGGDTYTTNGGAGGSGYLYIIWVD